MKEMILSELKIAKDQWRTGLALVVLGFTAAEVYYRFPFYRAAFEHFVLGQ